MASWINLGDLRDHAKPADAPALIDCLDWEHPRESTHGDVDRLARACARALVARGLKRGDAVAIVAANRAEFVIAYFGAMRAGLVAVPVNIRFPRETIDFVLRDSQVKLVLCDRARRTLIPADLPTVDFDEGFAAFLDPGRVHDDRARARRDGDGALHLRIDGPPQRRAALARRPAVDRGGPGDRARRRSASAHRGRAALPHERARHRQGGARRARQRRAAAAVRRAAVHRGHRPLPA